MYRDELFEQLGLTKTAGISDYLFRDIGDRYAKAGRKDAPSFLGHVGDFFRSGVVGSPLTLKDELAKKTQDHGLLGGLGRQLKDFYWHDPTTKERVRNYELSMLRGQGRTDSPLYKRLSGDHLKSTAGRYASNALSLGLPAYEFYHAMKDGDPSQRRGDIASGIAGLAMAPFTSRLGIPGTLVQGAGQNLVRRLVSPRETAPNYKQPFDPATHLRLTARGMAASSPVDLPDPT